MSSPLEFQTLVVHPGGQIVPTVEEVGSLGPYHVLVRIQAAAIHPADLNAIEGKYPGTPAEPFVGGKEGAGVVESVGPEVSEFRPGDRVIVPARGGTWRDANVYRPDELTLIPPTMPLEQAALVRINPSSALCMLRGYVDLQPGEWIAQNAANSGVGQAVIQLARHFGWRTINLVRDLSSVDERLRATGDLFFPDCESIEVGEVAGAKNLRLALNAVGGESALRLLNGLADSGTLVTYGAMARRPLKVPNGLLIFRDLALRGFWLTRWAKNQPHEVRQAMLAELIELASAGVLHSAIDTVYPLSAFADALAHAGQGHRKGKILFGGETLKT